MRIKKIYINKTFLSILVFGVFLVTIFVFYRVSRARADCVDCLYGCNTYCEEGYSTCNGDCHCCSRSDFAQKEYGVDCSCYSCGNCECNSPPPPPPCTPGCSCTASCPGDATTTYTGPYCVNGTHSGSCVDDCGSTATCGSGVTCYDPENSSAPSAPSRLYLCYGAVSKNKCIPLSQNSTLPTRIVLPSTTTAVYIKAEEVTTSGGRGARYLFRIDETPSSFKSDCNPVNAGDYCDLVWRSETYTQNLNPSSGANDNKVALAHGKSYNVWAHAGNLNKCDDNVKVGAGWPSVSGYFTINTPPTVESVTPSEGLSGAIQSHDIPTDCDPKNPLTLTTVFEDADGCNDMSYTGLGVGASSPTIADKINSITGSVRSGSHIIIYAEGTVANGEYPIIELRINGRAVRHFYDVNGGVKRYGYRHSAPVSLSEISVVMYGDQCHPSGCGVEDRNLRVDKIWLDGNLYETEAAGVSTNSRPGATPANKEWIYHQAGSIQFHGSSKITSGRRFYGRGYQDMGSGNTSDGGNYFWSVPNGGNAISSTSTKVCSPTSLGLDDLTGAACDNPDNTLGAWRVKSATCSGNQLTIEWEVSFLDYLSSSTNIYDIYAIVSDLPGQFSAGNWVDIGERTLDLDPPLTTLSIEHQSDDPADSMHFLQRATDEGSRDSGLRRVFNRFYEIERGDANIICGIADGNCSNPTGGQVMLPGFPARWLADSQQDDMRIGFQGGDVVTGSFLAEDQACNISEAIVASHPAIAREWMMTRFGDTFAALGYSDPIQPANTPFATYWVGSLSGPWDFGSGIDSDLGWTSRTYSDSNSSGNWYEVLYRLARRSDWVAREGIENVSSAATLRNRFASSNDGVYLYTGSTKVTIPAGSCNGRKVIFISSAELEITPDILLANANSACLFVSKGRITVLPGGDAANAENEDRVQLAFITDGRFVSAADSNFDKLNIRGFVFAKQTEFNRDLVFDANMQFPAETIVYDPRYLYLLRDMLGTRPFEQFECGTAQGVDVCSGW